MPNAAHDAQDRLHAMVSRHSAILERLSKGDTTLLPTELSRFAQEIAMIVEAMSATITNAYAGVVLAKSLLASVPRPPKGSPPREAWERLAGVLNQVLVTLEGRDPTPSSRKS